MTYKEFIQKYGEEDVTFSSYYKYSFTFKNKKLMVGCGGNHDDIYKLKVDTDPVKVKTIEPTWAIVGEKLYNFEW